MQLGLRICAVLIAAIAYCGVTVVVLTQTGLAGSEPGRLFRSAVLWAQLEALPSDGNSRPPQMCGYPAPGERVSLSHSQVVQIARCLNREGRLGSVSLATVVDSDLAIRERSCPASSIPPFLSQLWCGVDRGVSTLNGTTYYGGLRAQPWWFIALWTVGLGVVAWLVAFRLPYWRGEHVETTLVRRLTGVGLAAAGLMAVGAAYATGHAVCDDLGILDSRGRAGAEAAAYVLPFLSAIMASAALRLLVVTGGLATWFTAAGLGLFAFGLAVAAGAVGGLDAGCFVGLT